MYDLKYVYVVFCMYIKTKYLILVVKMMRAAKNKHNNKHNLSGKSSENLKISMTMLKSSSGTEI